MTYDQAKAMAMESVSPHLGEVRYYQTLGVASRQIAMRVDGFDGKWIEVTELNRDAPIKNYQHSLRQWVLMVCLGFYKEQP